MKGGRATVVAKGWSRAGSKSKYRNIKKVVDGIVFDSTAEFRRYKDLKVLQEAGEISELKVHPKFELQPAFTDREGNKHRSITYEADFSYFDRELFAYVVEDVKGVRTIEFNLKLKMLLYQNRAFLFRLVKVTDERPKVLKKHS